MPMTGRERKAALVRKGITQAQIARATGFSQAYVSDVVAGNRRSEPIESLIAKVIEEPIENVFPPREVPPAVTA